MQKLLWIGLAGALGTTARYLLGGMVQRLGGAAFPWGTLVVNMLGSFLFGVIWSLAEGRLLISVETRIIILAGFMGAFTTFSTFMFETGALLREAQWGLAALNLLGQNIMGLVCLFLGLAAGRLR
jgi:fluoride exporter